MFEKYETRSFTFINTGENVIGMNGKSTDWRGIYLKHPNTQNYFMLSNNSAVISIPYIPND